MQRHYLALAKEKRSLLQVLVHSDTGDSMRPHRRTSVVFNPRLFPWLTRTDYNLSTFSKQVIKNTMLITNKIV